MIIAIKQLAFHCGPACLAMVLSVCGYPVDQAVIGNDLRVIERKGCLSQDIAQYLRAYGLKADVTKDVFDIQPLQIVKTDKHFMLVVGKEGNDYVLVEPLGGMFTKRDESWFKQKVHEVIRIQEGESQCVL
jgi:ABC-type bacteriocin/lantibiotic exporter with double-glycine peptidase domain